MRACPRLLVPASGGCSPPGLPAAVGRQDRQPGRGRRPVHYVRAPARPPHWLRRRSNRRGPRGDRRRPAPRPARQVPRRWAAPGPGDGGRRRGQGAAGRGLAVWHDAPAVAYAVAFGLAAGQAFFGPAAQSLLPSLVADDELVAANSGICTAAVTAQVLVAPVAALLATRVGFGAAFAVNAASFGVSGLVLAGLREPGRAAAVSVSSPFRHAREGLAAIAALPLLTALAVGQFLAALSAGATSALLVVLAQDRLGGGGRYGLLVGAIGVGAALGRATSEQVAATFTDQLSRVFGPRAAQPRQVHVLDWSRERYTRRAERTAARVRPRPRLHRRAVEGPHPG